MQTEIHPLILNNFLFYILSYAPGIIWQEDPAWWNNCSAQGALTNPEGADPISFAKVWSRCMGFNSIIKYFGQLWVQRNLPRTKIWVRFHLFVRIKLSKSFEEEPARKHELRWLFDWHLPLPVTWRDIQALTEIEAFFVAKGMTSSTTNWVKQVLDKTNLFFQLVKLNW